MIKYIFTLLISTLVLISCNSDIPVIGIPEHGDNGLLSDTYRLSPEMKKNIEGIYNVSQGANYFGEQVVLKFTGQDYLSIFTGKNTAFFVLKGGYLDSTIIFEGYWRFANGSSTGLVSLHIKKEDGGNELVSGIKPNNIRIKGIYGNNTANPSSLLTFEFDSKLKVEAGIDFQIIGHRGGGRNIDRLGASENSLEIIRMASRFGATGIEIDIQLTKDSIPILYHDENFSRRLIDEEFFIGPLSNYTYKQISAFCILKNGEEIPTLREALETIIAETNLKFVWLDIKSKGILHKIAPIQYEFIDKASQVNRDLKIVLGMPTNTVVEDYLNLMNKTNNPALCELSLDKTINVGATIWAPRWSAGFSEDDINEAHNSGLGFYIWTLDEPDIINNYMNKFDIDGVLSNYPSLIAYEYYIQK